MTQNIKTRVLVVGGGPGGYVAAIRAGQLGLDTTLVEADSLGGTCLMRGCIPSKALIYAAGTFATMRRHSETGRLGIALKEGATLDLAQTSIWKDEIVGKLNSGVATLLRNAKVRVLRGWATFSDAKTCRVDQADGHVQVSAEHVILANGSRSVELPGLPFGGPVISSTDALSLIELPKRLVVIGAGYIGLELGTAFCKLGAEVTLVEAADTILPSYDRQLTSPVRAWLNQAGISVHLGAQAVRVISEGGRHRLVVRTSDESIAELPADKILVTVGRTPATAGWGLETMAVDLEGTFVKVDDQCRTSMTDVWAIGDLVGEPMLAHKASAQGEMVAEVIAGKRRRFDPAAVPAVCFTDPEIVSVGIRPDEAAARRLGAIVETFPFAANGRALTMEAGESGGFVRIVSRSHDHRILGIQAVGAHVSELSGEFALALEMGAVLEDIAGTIHAHPTLSEAIQEAALRRLHRV